MANELTVADLRAFCDRLAKHAQSRMDQFTAEAAVTSSAVQEGLDDRYGWYWARRNVCLDLVEIIDRGELPE